MASDDEVMCQASCKVSNVTKQTKSSWDESNNGKGVMGEAMCRNTGMRKYRKRQRGVQGKDRITRENPYAFPWVCPCTLAFLLNKRIAPHDKGGYMTWGFWARRIASGYRLGQTEGKVQSNSDLTVLANTKVSTNKHNATSILWTVSVIASVMIRNTKFL